jgi:hypothetical protein
MTQDLPEMAADGSTLTEALAALEKGGFVGQMATGEAGRIHCYGCGQERPAQEFAIEVLRRLEGVSDPADMLAVAGTICPVCQAKGTLVLSYGPEASMEDNEVLRAIEDCRPDLQ